MLKSLWADEGIQTAFQRFAIFLFVTSDMGRHSHAFTYFATMTVEGITSCKLDFSSRNSYNTDSMRKLSTFTRSGWLRVAIACLNASVVLEADHQSLIFIAVVSRGIRLVRNMCCC